jgi:predicted  nucleic acid-binding Zn-ribbon protein
MPHQCTNCGRTFDDGSTEMLSGCPDCGGNKFQFRPARSTESPPPEATGTAATDDGPTDAGAGPAAEPAGSTPSHRADDARTPARSDDVTASSRTPDTEDGAQASARTDVVSPDELAAAAEPTDPSAEPTDPSAEPTETRQADESTPSEGDPADPKLDALRQKLNDQFESIRIVSPGQYELNLMELYDREEYIISLREDGRYVIEMPEGWDDR